MRPRNTFTDSPAFDFDARRRAPLLWALACAAAGVVATAGLFLHVQPAFGRSLVMGALAVAALVLAAKRPAIFLHVFVAFLFAEGMIKQIFPHTATFFLRDAALAILYAAWFVKYPLARGFRGRYDKGVSSAVAAFVLLTLVLTVIPFTDESLLYRLGGARWWLANVPLVFVGADILRSKKDFDRLAGFFLACAGAAGIYGLLQYGFGFDHLVPLGRGYEDLIVWSQWYGLDAPQELRRRVFATFDLPTYFGYAMQLACLVAVAYAAHARRLGTRLILLVLVVVCLAGLLLSGTREAYIPLVVGVAAYVLIERRRKRVAVPLATMAGGIALALVLSRSVYLYRMLLVATDYEYTFSRLAWDWEKALALVRDHPFGLGISTSAKIGRAFGEGGYGPTFRFIENGYGQALVSLGWPGLAAFVAMLAAVAFRLKRAACADREANWRAGLCFAFCFSQFFPLLTHMTLYTGVWPAMYWLMAGAGTAAALSPAEGRGDERPSPNPRTTGGLIPLNGARAAAPGRRRPGD